jgi:hypothetical protein
MPTDRLPAPQEEGQGEELKRLRSRKADCGVCGVPAKHWVEVGRSGYFVPRCDVHIESPPYQVEARLDTLHAERHGFQARIDADRASAAFLRDLAQRLSSEAQIREWEREEDKQERQSAEAEMEEDHRG